MSRGEGRSRGPCAVCTLPSHSLALAPLRRLSNPVCHASALTALPCACICAQTPSAAAPLEEPGTGEGQKPEDALVFFQQQTSSMDREALLARVAEAAAKEADAVTRLGQLTCVARLLESGKQGLGNALQLSTPPAPRLHLRRSLLPALPAVPDPPLPHTGSSWRPRRS